MIYLFSFLAGIGGGLAGFAVGVAIGMAVNAAFSVSNFEGGSGYLVVFVYGPIGSLIGLALGIALMLHYKEGGRPGVAEIAAHFALTLTAIAAITGAIFGVLHLNQPHLNPNGPAPKLEFEIRLPPGTAPPPPTSIRADLDTPGNQMPASIDTGIRRDGGRAVLTGSVDLYQRTTQRVLALKMDAQPVWLFTVQLASKPGYSATFNDWRQAQLIDEMKPGSQPRKPGPLESAEMRYRVRDPSGEGR